ncbi:GNAT family N-acetyltransferase [Agreia pratensis]|uniref:Acetyltransferase (GNAT) family protein n=1 Tax=Agreia pratensis TaxID=150121 RepID=A0A1X7IW51_9MICO|nr:GNAT family N-acetyltransferase [Agreia pratensis]MBF4636016.1 GNAT family N-acetyltransferase [Agreia pratensis]SMG19313.1 Acetyltransferase (GNAT) family protein [Agreia pratensis]
MNWKIAPVDYDHPDADRLRREQRRELDARYGSSDHEPGIPPSADDVPVFLVATDPSGRAIACGGLRPLDDTVVGAHSVEIKRMYVVPQARGTGVATAVLRALEAAAATLGAHRVVLETGTQQPDAIRFYEREGYESIPLFGSYIGGAESVCFGRPVSAVTPAAP